MAKRKSKLAFSFSLLNARQYSHQIKQASQEANETCGIEACKDQIGHQKASQRATQEENCED